MLNPDISTEDALALLSSRGADADEPGPHGWSRRRFLQAISAGLLGGALAGPIADDLWGGVPDTWAAPIGPTDKMLVVVTLHGGFDGLNTVVPYTNGAYFSARQGLAVPAGQVLAIDGSVGLAPQLPYLKQLYDLGNTAIVQGVGYANPDLSHFTSMAIWMHGHVPGGLPTTGWIGRWLDALDGNQAAFAAATLDQSVALHLRGATRQAVGIDPYGRLFGASTNVSDRRLFAGLRAMAGAGAPPSELHGRYAAALASQLDLADLVGPTMSQTVPSGGQLTRKLTQAARLLNADVGLRVVDVATGGFDTHDNQQPAFPNLLVDLDTGLQSFFATLSPSLQGRVTVVVLSEFGRTVATNGSAGTDHGTANPVFVIGTQVRGGLYGQHPSLTALDGNKRMHSHVDFRWVYGSLLDGWLGADAQQILNGSYSDLALFEASPGPLPPAPGVPTVVTPPTPPTIAPTPAPTPVYDRSAASGYSPVTPLRLLDTRDGTGGRATALRRGETLPVHLADRYGVPADATAVVLNVTAVAPTANTYLLAWSGASPMPVATSMTAPAGRVTAGLVVTKLDPAGNCALYHHAGDVDLVIDLVGYFAPSAPLRLASAAPRRLFDTRDANWPIGEGQELEIPVRGWAGVPESAEVVIANITLTEPTRATHLTAGPSGRPVPVVSHLNAHAGQTVANLAFVELGINGSIRLRNNSGQVHVLVDVLGVLDRTGTSEFIPLEPNRMIDTRTQQRPLRTARTELLGALANGAATALLSVVTGIDADTAGFVTLCGDSNLRTHSNVNLAAGETMSNLALTSGTALSAVTNVDGIHLAVDVIGAFRAP